MHSAEVPIGSGKARQDDGMLHVPSGLGKSVSTHRDYASMGWHDAQLHGVAFGATDGDDPDYSFALDLDYIVRWIHGDPVFSFWIAPVTLVFENAWNVRIEGTFEQMNMAEVVDMHHVRHFANAAGVEFDEWHVQGDGFDVRIDSSGFTQYFRRAPILSESQWLPEEERSGVSFSRATFDL